MSNALDKVDGVECTTCKRHYSDMRYFRMHTRYPSNSNCLSAWQSSVGVRQDTTASSRVVPSPPSQHAPLESSDDSCDDEELSCSSEVIGCDDDRLPLAIEESEWDFPLVDDESSVCTTEEVSFDILSDNNPTLSDGCNEVSFSVNEFCETDVNISRDNVPHSDGNCETLAVGGEAIAPFGNNMWWPESANLTNRQYLEDFYNYCVYTQMNTIPLQGVFRSNVELLCLISKRRVPFCLYEEIYGWHVQYSPDKRKCFPRSKVNALLEQRYYQLHTKPFERHVRLPHWEYDVTLVCHNFESQVVSLLTDPRIKAEDYLFIDGDPRKVVPDNLEYVGDLNTGLSYRAAEKQLIVDSTRQKCVPLIFYLDGATVTNCNGLTMCALKFTLGIFDASTRDKAYAYRVLGYMARIPKASSKSGQQQFDNSSHVDAKEFFPTKPEAAEEEDGAGEDDDTDEKTEQFHAMLDYFLVDVKKYMSDDSRNIMWLLGGKYLMELVMYVELIKGDSAESDKHCGKYQTRTGNVKHLCRYCHVPNARTDDPYAEFALKTKNEIQLLVARKDLVSLKGMSQHLMNNCWYRLRFSPHCPGNVHACTPLDILHWLQINKFTYIVQCFYEQTGEDSQLCKAIEAVAASMGPLFQRQSDSAATRTSFQKGLKPGNITGHMRSGIMLVLLSVLRSSKGRAEFAHYSAKYARFREHFGTRQKILDWIILIERYITMETWLRQKRILVSDVNLFRQKVRRLMSHEKQVCKRQAGMQFRTFNYHAALHIADQILNFGVMSGFNCESNEMHHKDDKSDALRTQKRESNFEIQLARNIHGRLTYDYAVLEMKESMKVHEFFDRTWEIRDIVAEPLQQQCTRLGGFRWSFAYKHSDSNEHDIRLFCAKDRKKDCMPHKDLVEYLEEKLDEFEGSIDSLVMYTQLVYDGSCYRASPKFMGGPWRDWAMVKLPGVGNNIVPCHIWAFVDMREIPEACQINRGIYMIIETTRKNNWPSEQNFGTLFEPFIKNTTIREGSRRVFRDYVMLNVQCIQGTAIVIPDLANKIPNSCLRLLPKSQWASTFQDWLRE